MLRDALSRERSSQEENRKANTEVNPGDQKLDGEEFNVINHEDVEDLDDEKEEEAEKSFYRPGLAGLLGGRMMQRGRKSPGNFDHLHPFTQVLSLSCVEDCVSLEAEAFTPNERCTQEKVRCCAQLVPSVSGSFQVQSFVRACSMLRCLSRNILRKSGRGRTLL
jgi:hypothetical protein